MLELGPRRPKKERTPNSDEQLVSQYLLITMAFETDDDYSSAVIQSVKRYWLQYHIARYL
jgi:hypothetical protein